MTSHLVDNIPHSRTKMDTDSGFPFDDDFDRDRTSFRTQLDDIAQRHPEFAQHLSFGNEFPFRGRRRSNDRQQPPPEAEFGRRHERPFGSRFEEFGFPFRRHFDEPDFYQEGPPPPQPQPTEKEVPREQEEKKPEEPEKVEQDLPKAQENPEVRKQNIQQSNTVDLGKNQEPLDDQRGQRSMSAPPENRPAQQRFVSSINIPIHTQTGGGDMGARASQPESQKPTERVIPIHVEGRDEPVLPRNANFTPPPTQPQQQHPPQQQQQQPQADRIFGRNPSHFTQFLNKGEPQMTPDDFFKQQQKNYQKQQQQNFQQQQAPPPQQQAPPAQQQAPPAQEAPQEPQPQEEPPKTLKPGQIEQIQNIQKDVSELMNQVEKFEGKPRDKQYLYLDEMLTRNLIKLDNIETEGKENIRQARKEAIKCIEGCIGILEAKANANEAKANAAQSDQDGGKMEVATAPEEKIEEKKPEDQAPVVKPEEASLEVSGVSRSGTVVSTAEVTPMEVAEVAAPAEEKKVEEKMEEVVDQPTESGEAASPPMEDKAEEKKEKKKGKKKDKAEKK